MQDVRDGLAELRLRLLLERQTGMPRWNLDSTTARNEWTTAESDIEALIEAEREGLLQLPKDIDARQHRVELSAALGFQQPEVEEKSA